MDKLANMINSPNANISDLFAEAALKSGPAFLQEICDVARVTFGAQLALIGSLRIVEARRIYVLGSSKQNPNIALEAYDVCAAPCRRVLTEATMVVHLEDLQNRFPDDPGVQAFASQSYIGFPLIDELGESIGIFVLEWDTPMSEEKSRNVIQTLETLLPRISAEVSTQIVEHAFQALMIPIDDETKDDTAIFRTIVLQAAALSQVHAVLLAQCIDDDAQDFKILAAAAGGDLLTSAEGHLVKYDGTPCHNLKTKDTFFLERDLQLAFPSMPLFQDLNAEAYLGFGARKKNGQPLGHLALIHDRPMAPRALRSPVLRVIASRSTQELRRHVAEAERKSLADTIVVRKKLESLGLMAGTIAHDFNNQLTAIIGHTELAMLDLPPAHSAMPSLQIAKDNMWRARDVIGDLMDFAGNASGSPAERLSLSDLINHTLSGLNAEIPQTCQIDVSIEDTQPEIFGHKAQIIQILGNLILNALEALEEREGAIKLQVSLVPISMQERGKCLTGCAPALPDMCVALEVTDTGRGMEIATAERVFDPFFSTKKSSRGLGLAGVLGIARRMQAGLTFQSQPEIGTSFRLYFPPAPTDPPTAFVPDQDSLTEHPNPSLGKILVVDDKPEVLDLISRQVERLGHEVVSVMSGYEAIALAKSTSDIRAVVIDVLMPGIDGWETLQRLRNISRDLPALVMSGYSQIEQGSKSDELKLVQVLNKPFSLERLKDSLENLLIDAQNYKVYSN
ncbi:MAG: response regulator [Aliishimia sp.]